ncbi:LiaI-LiaF-like domain-containing protein [Chloroflexota bacterium]
MDEQKPGARRDIPVWGIFLLFLGVVLMLQTVNVLPWSLWGTLWRFWPALLIAAGIGILLRHYNYWLISSAVLLLFFGCLGIAIWQYGATPPEQHPQIRAEVQQELENILREINLSCDMDRIDTN